jgi:hypothetical protein
MDKKVIKQLSDHLGMLYAPGPGPAPVLPPGAPSTTVCYLGFGKYVLYITSVLAVPGLAKCAADAPALHAKKSSSRMMRRAELVEMVSLEWLPLASVLASVGDRHRGR